jgi:Ser/Thr protein kinase RdoA (MazF antagonist)
VSIPQSLRKRINYQGEFDELLQDVCASYIIGDFVSFSLIELGYEDVNLKLTTTKGHFFVKIFAERRDDAECLRLINIIKIAIDNGVCHPKFLDRREGYIFRNQYEQFKIRLAVFEYIEGETFFEMKREPTPAEFKKIIEMATKVNTIDYVVPFLYDPWAIVNFISELKKAGKYLDEKTKKVMEELREVFEKVDIKSLPHSLVHGDLISTNIMKKKEEIYFVDFSVANYYPRIVELAVLMSDIMLDKSGNASLEKRYKFLISEYQKYISLTKEELGVLPLFVKIANAMNIIGSILEKETKKNDSEENKYWMETGKKGLKESLLLWK